MVGESIRKSRPEIIKELNRRIANIKFNPDIGSFGDKNIEVIDIYVSVFGQIPADSMLHVELLIRGYEHTVFTEDIPFTKLCNANWAKSYTLAEIRIEIQRVIDFFLSEMCEHSTQGSEGKLIINDSFCA